MELPDARAYARLFASSANATGSIECRAAGRHVLPVRNRLAPVQLVVQARSDHWKARKVARSGVAYRSLLAKVEPNPASSKAGSRNSTISPCIQPFDP
jgi:hypothetical protein